jgi:hypothetical protein
MEAIVKRLLASFSPLQETLDDIRAELLDQSLNAISSSILPFQIVEHLNI